MARDIEEILKDVNNTNDFQSIVDLWNEIATNKYQYTLTEIRNANVQIREIALKSNGSDLQIGHFYTNLSQMGQPCPPHKRKQL